MYYMGNIMYLAWLGAEWLPLKHNVDLAKSPTKKVRTQSNHIFLSILSFFKLERLKIKHKMNHFALRAQLLIKANQMAYQELQVFKSA